MSLYASFWINEISSDHKYMFDLWPGSKESNHIQNLKKKNQFLWITLKNGKWMG
jgi:hypothetical protein